MSISTPVLPDTAPFTPAQRSWLNGFLAGLASLAHGGAAAALPPVNGGVAVADAPVVGRTAAVEAEEEFPWHDSALGMDDRMKLAEGKPYARRLMAAMAQLDCGACGYLCKTYGEAIAGARKRT